MRKKGKKGNLLHFASIKLKICKNAFSRMNKLTSGYLFSSPKLYLKPNLETYLFKKFAAHSSSKAKGLT